MNARNTTQETSDPADREATRGRIARDAALIAAISDTQSRFVEGTDQAAVFERILGALLEVTGSEYGFIDELFRGDQGQPLLTARAITNIAWNEASRRSHAKFVSGELNFTNMKSLFGAVVTTGSPVIANDAPSDPRRCGIPEGHPPLRAFLGLPLVLGGELIGVAGLANGKGGYSEATVAYLEPLVRVSANLIGALRLDRRRRQAEAAAEKALADERAARAAAEALSARLAALQRVTDVTLGTLSLDDLVRESVARIRAVVGADVVLFWLLGDDGQTVLRAAIGLAELETLARERHVSRPERHHFATEVARARASVAVEDTSTIHLSFPILQERVKSVVGTPLQLGSQLIGVIVVGTFVPRAFDAETVRLVELIAERLAGAVERARHLESERAARAAAEALSARLSALDRVTDATLKTLGLDELMRESLARIRAELQVEVALFWLLGEDGHSVLRAANGLPELEALAQRGLAARSEPDPFAIRVAATRASLVVEDPSTVRFASPLLQERLMSVIGTPLMLGERVLGVVLVGSLAPRSFAPESVRLLELVAERLAVAIDRIQHLDGEVRRQRLEDSNRDLQEFATIASHDLQEPLRKIQAFGDCLRESAGPKLDEESRDFLHRMQQAAARMQRLIEELLTFSRVTRKGQPFAPCDLGEVAQEVLADLETRIAETKGRVVVGPLPTIEADRLQMGQLLQNLIGNALKFHRRDVPPIVDVRAEIDRAAMTCRLSVTDNGIGFDEKYLPQLFQVFQRLHGRQAFEGTGMGLAICKRIVERHGGTIEAHARPDEGATFTATLPLRHPKGDKP